jgi:hypothetical protein
MANWIDIGTMNTDNLLYAYTTSLHWSMTQFTPASMEISARNTYERSFSIIVLFFAMVAFSSIVGSITGSMNSLRNMKTDEMKQFWLLRRYLRERGISKELSNRISRYLEHRCRSNSQRVQANSVRILDGLSANLNNELCYQLHSSLLSVHPFMAHLDQDMQVVVHRICSFALKPQTFSEMEGVFNAGEESAGMFFFKEGLVKYDRLGLVLSPGPRPREWFSEATLWCSWRHRGDLLALTTCEFISLDPTQFSSILSVHPRPWFFARRYGIQYISYLNLLEPLDLTDILRIHGLHDRLVKECCIQEDILADGEFASDKASTEVTLRQDLTDECAANDCLAIDCAPAPAPRLSTIHM